jgi:hypothetical protein
MLSKSTRAENSAKGGRIAAENLTPAQRKKRARDAARARWTLWRIGKGKLTVAESREAA